MKSKSLPNINSVNSNDFIKLRGGIKHSPSFVDVSLANAESNLKNGNDSAGALKNDEYDTKESELSYAQPIPDTPSKRVMVGEWILGKTIGVGSSGKVKMAVHYKTQETCVVKAVRRPNFTKTDGGAISQKMLERIHKRELLMIREAALGLVLDHPNIVHLHSTVLGGSHFYCFFEFVPGQDLVDYIGQLTRLSENEARHIFRQVVSAIEYAHRNHVVHRDIKLENIRYDPKTGIAKVLDFGFATFYSEKSILKTNCGSPCYASPEIYESRPYKGPEIDIWSLGVCLYGMVVGSLPFDGPNFNALSKSVKLARLYFPMHVSEDLKSLITFMLKPKSNERASIYDVSKHKWINDGYNHMPLDFLDYPGSRGVNPIISENYVNQMIGMNTAHAGAALMDVLDEYGARKRMEPPKGCEDYLKQHPVLEHQNEEEEEEDDDETVIEREDKLAELRSFHRQQQKQKRHERIKTAGVKLKEWWKRLFRMRKRTSVEAKPKEFKWFRPIVLQKHHRYATAAL